MTYDPERCAAFPVVNDHFTVPKHGEHRKTVDCRYCGGFVQNYLVTVMNWPKRRTPVSTIAVFDQNGTKVGQYDPGQHACSIGTVPDGTTYTVVISNASNKDEECILGFAGAI